MGVPMGYLSFQGSGASTVDATSDTADGGDAPPHAAPWCVNTWGPDLDGNGAYPLPLKQFQQALGVPLQLYAPYFCPGSEYFSRNNASSPWHSVLSDTSLDGCSFYGFQDVEPAQSRQFYDWFFAKGEDVGMVSFEPDFMNQVRNLNAAASSPPSLPTAYLSQLTEPCPPLPARQELQLRA